MTISLNTKVGSVSLECCIYNASGPRTGTSSSMAKIASSASGAVLAKSATLEAQTGNPLPRSWHSSSSKEAAKVSASFNSEGLPNSGIGYYLEESTISETLGDSDKPYMVSISGKTLNDNLTMLQNIFQRVKESNGTKIAAVEINLACPNVIGKPIIAYDFTQMEQVLDAVSKLYKKQKSSLPLGIKMPAYYDMPHFEAAASIINKYDDCIKFIVSINTVGNALAIDAHSEMPAISSNCGYAGLSGPSIKYTALANVNKMRQLLSPNIDVVGVGGIQTGQDVFEMILCGATAVQVGTCHWIEGPQCFGRIADELKCIMQQKGYESIQDFRGKLKKWNKEGASASRAARKKADAANMEENLDKKDEDNKTPLDVFTAIPSLLLLLIVGLLIDHKYSVVGIDSRESSLYFNTSVILLFAVAFLLAR